MSSLVAAIVSWHVFILGIAVGYFFGQYLIDLGKKAADLLWQFAKHAVVDLYQTVKNKMP
jgi:hypothetical protein